ncbi:hypothetical protein ADT71_10865 [Novosphingobium sp. ST904]|nr:hypothetical protein ADT71_10865 [Novosphingobium sp. ST904]
MVLIGTAMAPIRAIAAKVTANPGPLPNMKPTRVPLPTPRASKPLARAAESRSRPVNVALSTPDSVSRVMAHVPPWTRAADRISSGKVRALPGASSAHASLVTARSSSRWGHALSKAILRLAAGLGKFPAQGIAPASFPI